MYMHEGLSCKWDQAQPVQHATLPDADWHLVCMPVDIGQVLAIFTADIYC